MDLEVINAPGQAKACGLCAIVAKENGDMKVLFKRFVLPVHGDLSRGIKLSVEWNLMQQ